MRSRCRARREVAWRDGSPGGAGDGGGSAWRRAVLGGNKWHPETCQLGRSRAQPSSFPRLCPRCQPRCPELSTLSFVPGLRCALVPRACPRATLRGQEEGKQRAPSTIAAPQGPVVLLASLPQPRGTQQPQTAGVSPCLPCRVGRWWKRWNCRGSGETGGGLCWGNEGAVVGW